MGLSIVLTLYSGALEISLFLFAGVPPVLGSLTFAVAAILCVAGIRRLAQSFWIERDAAINLAVWTVYLIWAACSAAWTLSLDIAGSKLVTLVVYSSAFYLMGAIVGRSAEVAIAFRRWVVVLGVVTLFATLRTAFSGIEALRALAQKGSAESVFSTSYQATTLCIASAALLALIETLTATRSASRMVWLVVWITLSIATLAGGGRGAAVGAALAQMGILLLALLMRPSGQRRRMAAGIVVFLPLASLAAVYVALALKWRTIERLLNFASTSTDSTGRLTLWRHALDMADSSPLFGAGFGSYESSANTMVNAGYYPHNLFLETLAETGLIGFFLMSAAIVVAVVTVFLRFHRINFASMAMWLGFFVLMVFEANVSGTVTDRFLVFSLGMSLGLVSQTSAAALEPTIGVARGSLA